MHIKTKNKEIDIPNWLVLVGVLVVYDSAKKIRKKICNRKTCKHSKEK